MDKVKIFDTVQSWAPDAAMQSRSRAIILCTAKFTKLDDTVSIEYQPKVVCRSEIDSDCFVIFDGLEKGYVLGITKPIGGWVDDIILSSAASVGVKKKAVHTSASPYKGLDFIVINGEPYRTLQHYDIRYGDYMNFIVSRESTPFRGAFWGALDSEINKVLKF